MNMMTAIKSSAAAIVPAPMSCAEVSATHETASATEWTTLIKAWRNAEARFEAVLTEKGEAEEPYYDAKRALGKEPSVEFDALTTIKIAGQTLSLPQKTWSEASLDELRKINPELAQEFEQKLAVYKTALDEIEARFQPLIKKNERAEIRASNKASRLRNQIIAFPVTTMQQFVEKLEILDQSYTDQWYPEILEDAKRIGAASMQSASTASVDASPKETGKGRGGRILELEEHFEAMLTKQELYALSDRYQDMGVTMRMLAAMGTFDRVGLLKIAHEMFEEADPASATPNLFLDAIDSANDMVDFCRHLTTFYESIQARLFIVADDVIIEQGAESALID